MIVKKNYFKSVGFNGLDRVKFLRGNCKCKVVEANKSLRNLLLKCFKASTGGDGPEECGDYLVGVVMVENNLHFVSWYSDGSCAMNVPYGAGEDEIGGDSALLKSSLEKLVKFLNKSINTPIKEVYWYCQWKPDNNYFYFNEDGEISIVIE